MPNKYANKKGWVLKKQCYNITNWHDYNQALRNRGDIEFWIAEDIIKNGMSLTEFTTEQELQKSLVTLLLLPAMSYDKFTNYHFVRYKDSLTLFLE